MTQRLRRPIARVAGAASMLAAILAPSATRASEGGAPAIIAAYDVPAGCGSQESFAADVERRTRRRDAASAEAADHSFRIRVEGSGRNSGGNRFRGTIVVRRTGASPSEAERVVEGATCDEVTQALALVAALSMDEEAAAKAAAADPTATAGSDATAATSAAAATADPAAAARGPAAAAAADVAAPRAGTSAPEGFWSKAAIAVGAHAGAQGGAGPGVGLAFPLFAELGLARLSENGPLLRFAPTVRLTFVRGSTDTTVRTRGSASFTWTAGELDLCPLALGTRRLFATACARLELGALAGDGEQVEPARSETRLWAAVAAPVRLRFAVTRALFLELEGAPRAPLQRERFVFQPDITVFRAPPLAWAASAGAGITFP